MNNDMSTFTADVMNKRRSEQSSLGWMLTDRKGVTAAVGLPLKPEDLAIPEHQVIYRAILELHGQYSAIDPVTVAAFLDRRGELGSIGGVTYLMELTAAFGLSRAEQRRHLEHLQHIYGDRAQG